MASSATDIRGRRLHRKSRAEFHPASWSASAVRGTPGVGYEGHCAPSVDVTAMRMANTPAIHSLLVTKYDAPEKRRRPVYPLGLSVGSVSAAVVSSDYFWVPRSQARGGTHAALRTARRRGKPRFRDPTT